MQKRQLGATVAGLGGILLMASFSVQDNWFHSGWLGICGSGLIVGAYLSLNWPQWQAHNPRVRKVTWWLLGLCLVLAVLRGLETLV